jgi:hypothetical protein
LESPPSQFSKHHPQRSRLRLTQRFHGIISGTPQSNNLQFARASAFLGRLEIGKSLASNTVSQDGS